MIKCNHCGAKNIDGAKMCAVCGKEIEGKERFIGEGAKNPWYGSTWFIILMLLCFWPVALYLIWKYKPEWVTTNWFTILWLIIFPPVGFYLMWKNNKFNFVARVIITVAVSALWIWVFYYGATHQVDSSYSTTNNKYITNKNRTESNNTEKTINYYNAEALESDLNAGKKCEGKVALIICKELHPDSILGYNIYAGEHINLVSDKDPGIKEGAEVLIKTKKISKILDKSWKVEYELLEKNQYNFKDKLLNETIEIEKNKINPNQENKINDNVSSIVKEYNSEIDSAKKQLNNEIDNAAESIKDEMGLAGNIFSGFIDEYKDAYKEAVNEVGNAYKDTMNEYANSYDDIMKSLGY